MRICIAAVGALAAVLLLAAGALVVRLAQGPIPIDGLGPSIASALGERFGRAYVFQIGATAIGKGAAGPALAIDGFSLSEGGRTIVAAPKAEIAVDNAALLIGKVSPKRLEVFDLEVRLLMSKEGGVSISAGTDPAQAIPLKPDGTAPVVAAIEAAPDARLGDLARAGAALRVLLDSVLREDSPFGALDRLGIARGRLVIDDRLTSQTTIYEGLELAFDRTGDGASLSLSAEGPSGRWSLRVDAKGAADAQRVLTGELRDISIDEIALGIGARDVGLDFDMPLSARFAVTLAPDGALDAASARVMLGAGYGRLNDPDQEPFLIDEATARLHWAPSEKRVVVDALTLEAGATHYAARGTIEPPASDADAWRIALEADPDCVFGPERPGEAPIPIPHARIAAHLRLADKQLVIDHAEASAPDIGFTLSGAIDWVAGPHFKLDAAITPMPARTIVRLWPSFIAAPVRAWALEHAKAGMVEGDLSVDLDAAALEAMKQEHAPPDAASRVDFKVSDATVTFLPGAPPIAGLSGVGRATGRTAVFTADKGEIIPGPGHKLTIVEGVFTLPDGEPKPTPVFIKAHITGSIESVADMLSKEAMKSFGSLPIDTATIRGQVDARLGVDLRIQPPLTPMKPEDLAVRVNAQVSNFVVEKLLGREKLDAASLNVAFDKTGMKATGQGRMFNAPASIELHKTATGPTEAVVNVVVDEAARAKQGFGLGPGVTGPIGARVQAVLGQGDNARVNIDLDLTRTTLDNFLPGLLKPAGKAAKAVFVAQISPERIELDPFSFEGNGALARGAVTLGADGAFQAAKLSQLRISPGDDVRVEAEQRDAGMKLVVRGATLDARPFLKSLANPTVEPNAPNPKSEKELSATKDLDLDLKAGIVTGANKQAMTGVDFKMVRRQGSVQAFELNGRFGRETVTGAMGKRDPGQMQVSSANAGALLSFIDLYRHMDGGQINVGMKTSGGRYDGAILVRDFVLRDEPVMKRLIAQGMASNDRAPAARIDASAVSFTRLQAKFLRTPGRLELREGVMHGPQIGTTVEGWMDFAHERVDMNGTFVPAFQVNNLFGRIPVLGLLLGGGVNEGLFAINYRVSGPSSAPVLNVNPLSVIAPGVLRKMFGAGGGFPSDPTGAEPPVSSYSPSGQ